MNKAKVDTKIEKQIRHLIIMLLVAFVLGVFLTTVIAYDPTKHSTVQTVFLVAHILVAVDLLVTAFVHVLKSRKTHILGVKPIAGLVCIFGAFGSGSVAAQNSSDVSVLVMSLFFVAALVIYGLSYLSLQSASSTN